MSSSFRGSASGGGFGGSYDLDDGEHGMGGAAGADAYSPSAGGNGGAHTHDDENDALSQEFRDIMMENEILAKENRLFHSYLHRHGSGDLSANGNPAAQPVPAGALPPSAAIPLGLKFAMALEEQDLRVAELKGLGEKVVEDVALLRAIIESLKARTDELRKDTYEFQKSVVVAGEHPRTGRVMAETVLSFLTSHLAARRAFADKLAAKARTLKEQRTKLEAQAHAREGQRGRPLTTDFHQLQIKNQQSGVRIRELNNDLFRVKASAVRVVQQLNARRKDLAEAVARGAALRSEAADRAAATGRMRSELQAATAEARREARKQRQLLDQRNPDVPHVLDYVQQKALASELAAEVTSWERKVDIATMAVTRAKRALAKATAMRAEQAEAVRRSLQAGGAMFLPPLAGAKNGR